MSHSATSYGDTAFGQRPSGLLTFGAVLLIIVGFFNGLHGISAIFRAGPLGVATNSGYVLANVWIWGWTILALGILQVLSGVGVLAGSQVARWFGVVVIGLNAFGQMFFIPAYPVWSVLIIALDIVALYGLLRYGEPPTEQAYLEGREAQAPSQPTPPQQRTPRQPV